MTAQIDIQIACGDPAPSRDHLRLWLNTTLAETGARPDAEISVRLVDEAEMIRLNRGYRQRTGPTNVLSFPTDFPAETGLALLGDIVICAAVVQREAGEQDKPLAAHWAHMTVHGCLHLLGWDHIDPREALSMEAEETRILGKLGFPCPYSGHPQLEHAAL